MAKAKTKNSRRPARESDSTYFLKLVLFFVCGAQWLFLKSTVPLPLGLAVGLLFASHEHFQIDRKIEYAILLVAAALGIWLHAGLQIN